MWVNVACGVTAKVEIRSILIYVPDEEVQTIAVSHRVESLVLPWEILRSSRTSEELCRLILENKQLEIDSVVRRFTQTSAGVNAGLLEHVVPRRCILDSPLEHVKQEVVKGHPIVVDIEGKKRRDAHLACISRYAHVALILYYLHRKLLCIAAFVANSGNTF